MSYFFIVASDETAKLAALEDQNQSLKARLQEFPAQIAAFNLQEEQLKTTSAKSAEGKSNFLFLFLILFLNFVKEIAAIQEQSRVQVFFVTYICFHLNSGRRIKKSASLL